MTYTCSDEKSLEDQVASLCYNHFEKLPKKGKPLPEREWTIIAAVVQKIEKEENKSFTLDVVSMGTGSKCIGQNYLSSNGDMLNDSHAEVVARRGFLRYLYYQIEIAAATTGQSDVLVVDPCTNKFKQRKEVSFLFFSSHTPCGDASIIIKETKHIEIESNNELQPSPSIKETQNPTGDKGIDEGPPMKIPRIEIPDIHRTGAKCVEGGPQDPKQPGIYHHIVGVLRTKPGRGDQTLSMSCSDKLFKWLIMGLQGSLLMNFLSKPIYLSHMIIGGCAFNQSAIERALFDRFQNHVQKLENPLFFQHKPQVCQSQLKFKYSKREALSTTEDYQMQPCPSSICWCACPVKPLEVAVEGRKQGVTKKNQNRSACRLEICKKNLFQKFAILVKSFEPEKLPLNLKEICANLDKMTYNQAKRLATDYVEMWKQTRVQVLPTWTIKQSALTEFFIKDD